MVTNVNTQKLNAIKTLNEFSLRWNVELSPEEAKEAVSQFGQVNEFDGEKVAEMIEEINEIIPTYQGFEGNPNNGRKVHKFKVGKESSEVLYLDISKLSLKSQDVSYSLLEKALKQIAKKYGCDEFWTVENTEYSFVYRMWWD